MGQGGASAASWARPRIALDSAVLGDAGSPGSPVDRTTYMPYLTYSSRAEADLADRPRTIRRALLRTRLVGVGYGCQLPHQTVPTLVRFASAVGPWDRLGVGIPLLPSLPAMRPVLSFYSMGGRGAFK